MRTFLVKSAASLAFAFAASQAFAHAQLESATPPVGRNRRLAERDPSRLQRGSRAEIHRAHPDRSGRRGFARRPSVETGHQEVLIVPVKGTLAPGAYTVKWHAVSVDTHHTQGTFEFTVK